jgi:uncharacterized protein involved in type VI secretion and phage assembly
MRDTHALPDSPVAGAPWVTHLAEVVSVRDPRGLSRVQVRLLAYDGVAGQDGPLWARVAVPFAGEGRGSFLLPDVGDEVLVGFVGGDPRQPVVLGGLWNGTAKPPEQLGGDGDRVDRWTIKGKAGTRLAIVEERAGKATILLTTPGGVSAELTQSAGGKIELTAGGATVTVDTQGVTVRTGARVQVQASEVTVSAGRVTVDAVTAKFSGEVKCEVLRATTVVARTYTPGAGNLL